MKTGSQIPGLLVAVLMLAAPVHGANLIQNPSFEVECMDDSNSAMNWKMDHPDDHGDKWGSASRESWRSHDGQFTASIRGTWAERGNYGGWWQEAEVEGGRTFRLAAWLYADSAWTADLQEMKIEFWTMDRSKLLGAVTNAFTGVGELWSQQSIQGFAPEGTGWARVVFNVSGTGPAGALQIDLVTLEEVIPETGP